MLLELASDLPMGQLRADFYRVVDNPVPRQQSLLLSYAVALSVIVHLAGFLGWGEGDKPIELQHPAAVERSVSVQLMPAPRAEPPPADPLPQRVTPSEPEPRRVQTEATRKPAPVQHRQSRLQKKAAPVTQAAAAETAPAVKPAATPQVINSVSDTAASAAQQRAHYLTKLFAHIEQYKFYPAVARRQGLEAAVDVSFMLAAGGSVKEISINSGPKLLRHAAQQSLQRAAPLPAPPAGQSLPMRVEYRMVFALH